MVMHRVLLTILASIFSYPKKLAKLAINNHAAGFHIKEPPLKPKLKAPNSEGDNSGGDESEEEEENKMFSQRSIRSPSANSNKNLLIEEYLEVLHSSNGMVTNQSIQGFLPYPILSYQWVDFNHDLKVNEGFCLMRMVLYNYNKEDFDMDLLAEYIFKIEYRCERLIKPST